MGYINRCDHSNSLNDKKLSFSKEAPPPEHYESATQVSNSMTYIHRLLASSAGNTVQRMWKLIVGGINFTPLLMIKDRISEKRMTFGHQWVHSGSFFTTPCLFMDNHIRVQCSIIPVGKSNKFVHLIVFMDLQSTFNFFSTLVNSLYLLTHSTCYWFVGCFGIPSFWLLVLITSPPCINFTDSTLPCFRRQQYT